jgi:phosphoesterase RecJ-like protein
MQKNTASQFKKAIDKANCISIVTHWSPDGDAMGSSLALYHFLKQLNKKVKVIVPNDYPDFLKWLPGNKEVLNHSFERKKTESFIDKSDLIFTLDFNAVSRIEELGKVIVKNPCIKIMIDHHQQPENYAQLYYHDVNASSTCELIYEFITILKGKNLINTKIATCIYTGILTDTGGFRFPSASAKTHKIAADLIEKGINHSDIYNAVHDDNTENRLKLLGHCLSKKMHVFPQYHAALISLSQKEQDQFNFQRGDTEGVVNYPLSIRGIKLSAFFAERDGVIKISFRSKGKFDVNVFARKYFSGGGHKNAAGGKSNETMEVVVEKFKQLLTEIDLKLFK